MPDASKRAALAGLQAFLDEDADYTALLQRLETGAHRRLRFAGAPRSEELQDVWTFLETASHLRHCHQFFQQKLRRLADSGVKSGDVLESADCGRLVDALDDLLGVCRVLYGRLYVKSNAIQSALERAVAAANGAQDVSNVAASAVILSSFLQSEKMSPEALANSALARFDAIIEFVEALSKALQGSTDDDGVVAAIVGEAPRLLRIAQENKHYVHLAQMDAREEQELIALQTRFVGDRAHAFRDLAASKLLAHADVQVSDYDASPQASLNERRSQHAHCFQDGCLVLSEQGAGGEFDIQYVLRLKDDAVFLENVPDLVAEQQKLPVGTFALITEDESRAVSIQDEGTRQQWVDAISGFLVSNDARSCTLTNERAKEVLELPADVQKEANDAGSGLLQFPSFHDDPLPGVFWLCVGDGEGDRAGWRLVEIALVAEHWLVVFCLQGWRKHSQLLCLDMAQADATVNDEPSGDKEWSLVVASRSGAESEAGSKSIRLVSKKRTRIDFWFDQVAKVIVEKQTAEERAARADQTATNKPERKAPAREAKKRKKLVPEEDETEVLHDSDVAGKSATDGSTESALAAPVPETARTSKTAAAAAAPSTPKNPKRRWMKRKSEDPQDSALINTPASQPDGGNGATRRSTSGDSTASVANTNTTSTTKGNRLEPDSAAAAVRIILTGIEATPAVRKKIRAIASAEYEEDIERATHVVAPKDTLKRTVKLLCGISCCAHVLDERWLDESARAGTAVYERAHCLKDAKAEAKWGFDLKKTMYDSTSAQRRALFAGHTVFITNHKSILPPVKDLVKIVECAGGRATTKGAAGPNDLVITNEAAVAVASVQKALAGADPQRIYSPELVLSSILQQRIDLDQHRVSVTKSSGANSRRRK